ncbi:MAG: ThuA domain-containing protein [Gammaproteobacteria bacterium]|nr:ThuA domain-containing protein [Gammaproteobacteria bacterium]
MTLRAHLITGGFPLGSNAGHDMDYVRLQLLDALYKARFQTTLSSSFTDIADYLASSDLCMSYVAGPFPDEVQCEAMNEWLEQGGRWFALHGTSGGKAARIEGESRRRKMVRLPHHDLLGAFFLNHPPIRRFKVEVQDAQHALFEGLPPTFEVADELYLIEPMPDSTHLMTTDLPSDPSPPGFGFVYDEDTSLRSDGRTRVLGTERTVGRGAVIYIALGHTHAPENNSQPFVDESVTSDGSTPTTFRGVWDDKNFRQIVNNGIAWGASS